MTTSQVRKGRDMTGIYVEITYPDGTRSPRVHREYLCPACKGTGERTLASDAGGFGGETCSRCVGAGHTYDGD